MNKRKGRRKNKEKLQELWDTIKKALQASQKEKQKGIGNQLNNSRKFQFREGLRCPGSSTEL